MTSLALKTLKTNAAKYIDPETMVLKLGLKERFDDTEVLKCVSRSNGLTS